MRHNFTAPVNFVRVILIAFVILICAKGKSHATHAMGADLTYQCLGGDTYRFTLTVYRDCSGINLTTAQNIEFGSDSCGVSTFILSAPRVSLVELSPLCPSQQPNSSCNGGPLPGVEEHTYEVIHTLTQSCPDWKISWQLCCRNLAITNSVITASTRMYIESYLNNLDVFCNNSPFFTTPPVPYLCDLEPFNFNNGTIDPDGDSLVYELAIPLDYYGGAPQNIPYLPGFSVNYPMATSPPNAFNFDAPSGQFSFTPNGLQQGIVALKVNEYRNGLLIGSTIRDIQMVVINCSNQSPIINPPYNVTGGILTGNTFSVCAGNTLNFNISASDPDAGDILNFYTSLATAIPGAVFTTTGTNPVVGTFDWPTSVADIGNYFFSMTVEDDGCPITGKQILGFNVIVQTGEILPPRDTLICPTTTATLVFPTSIPDTSVGGSYTWTPATGLSNPNIANPTITLTGNSANYIVSYSSPTICPILEPIEIKPEGVLSLPEDTTHICLGDSAQLSATFTLSGTNVPFTLTWDPPTGLSNPAIPNPKASPATTTLYSVTASTLTCDYTSTVLVVVDQPPTLNPLTDPSICSGNSTTLTTSGSNLAQATYSWFPTLGLNNPSSPNPVASPTTTTTYQVKATNACGVSTQNVTVTVFPPLSINLSPVQVSCTGASDGQITATVLGGDGGPASYVWTPNVGSTATVTNLPAGTYTVTATDGSNCSATNSYTLNDPPPLSVTVTGTTDIACFEDNTGVISVTGAGGTPGYEFSIDGTNFYGISTFSSLVSGTYTVTIRDANGCTETSPPITLTQPLSGVDGIFVSKTNADCNTTLGALAVSASGGFSPYDFSIDGGMTFQPTGSFTGLAPALYIVTVRDSLGCTDTVHVDIVEVADPSAQIDTVIHVSCFGGADGSVTVSGLSGTPPYQFSIDGGMTFTSSTTFTGLSAGFYEIILRDAIACLYGLNFTVTQPDSLFGIVGIQTDVKCNGDNTGTVTVLPFGGVPPYTYSDDGVTFTPDSNFINLGAGVHSFDIQDANGCIVPVAVSISEPTQLIATIPQQTNVDCAGNYSGSVTISGTGGSGSYLYSINGSPFFTDSVFSNLPAGTYGFKVQDTNGCTDSTTVQITEPLPVDVAVIDTVDVLCYNTASGSITVAGSGGTAPYEYSIDSGNSYDSSPTISGLIAGFYTVIVRDANGCMDEDSVSIDEPTQLLGDIISTDISCFGDSNGTATANPFGGTEPYSYLWSTGSTQQTATGLGPGNYIVLVTDDNDCQISLSIEIIEPPLFSADSSNQVDILCFGEENGSAEIFVSGGIPSYTYEWSNGNRTSAISNVGAGTYFVTATDSNGCTVLDTFDITQPEDLIIELVDAEDSYCDLPNGFITVEASGGIPEYNYLWNTNPPQEGVMVSDLFGEPLGGPYVVTVTDQNNCVDSLSVTIGAIPSPIAAFTTNYFPLDTFITDDLDVEFINQSENAIAYLWNFGDGTNSDEENPIHRYREDGYYEVSLIAYESSLECPDTARLGFTILPPGAIYVPNAFTPNNDGTNDNFFPVGIGVVEVEMNIYDRWGRHLITLNSMEEKWNGNHISGKPAQEGVYVFVINAVLNDGREFFKAGTVTLYR